MYFSVDKTKLRYLLFIQMSIMTAPPRKLISVSMPRSWHTPLHMAPRGQNTHQNFTKRTLAEF